MKTIIKSDIFLILLSIFFVSCTQSEMLPIDFDSFNGTKAEKLAHAVRRQKVETIRKEILEKNIPVDIKNEKGTTLLMMATYWGKEKSVKCLLELGANPNLYEDCMINSGYNSVLIASYYSCPTPEIMRLLLAYGGNPNSETRGDFEWGNEMVPYRDYALSIAAEHSLAKVKLLIEAGADVNGISKTFETTALNSACIHGQMDIALYLLQKGADYTIKFQRIGNIGEYYIDILEELRETCLPLNSKQYKYKLRVIRFLKTKGLDYYKTPVPDWIQKKIKDLYPDNWEYYLAHY